ncbi:hypothetical protein MG293_006250 [Ovis ammon polii]|uniref:Pleiotrophin n=2 Tax=Ovis TaxID=9935 RepID=A0AAD4UCD0_OVIAM|nr:hypothetical protein MG293_006250 [Ovis ammon polii]
MRSSGLAVGSAAMTIATSLLPGYVFLHALYICQIKLPKYRMHCVNLFQKPPRLCRVYQYNKGRLKSCLKVTLRSLQGVRQSEAGSGSPPSSPKIPPRPQSRGKAEVERGEEREQGVTGRAGAESSGRREHQRLGYLDSGQKNLSRINKGSLSAHRSFATPKPQPAASFAINQNILDVAVYTTLKMGSKREFTLRMQTPQYLQQRRKFAAAFLAFIFILAAVGTAEAGKKEKPEKKVKKSDCGEWQWSVCVPTSGDCGLGTREGTRTGAECKQTMKTQRCKIPCNWKKQFGAECKYQFQAWGECDLNTALKTRTGSLKRALHNADCQKTVTISKPCGKLTKSKPQAESKKKKKEGKKQEKMLD